MSDWPGWARRLITIPILYLSWALTLALLPPLLVVALVIDLVRAARGIKPTAWRLLAFLLTYLTVEALGMVCGLGIWLASGFGHNRRRLMRWTYVAQGVWANVLWDTTCTVFRLRVSVSGDKNVTPGPLVVLSRHASIVDNILPFQLFTRRNRMNLRYVIKKELVIDPAIDIAGHWLPNHFVDRGGGEMTERSRLCDSWRPAFASTMESSSFRREPGSPRASSDASSTSSRDAIPASTKRPESSAMCYRRARAVQSQFSKRRGQTWPWSPITASMVLPTSQTSGAAGWWEDTSGFESLATRTTASPPGATSASTGSSDCGRRWMTG